MCFLGGLSDTPSLSESIPISLNSTGESLKIWETLAETATREVEEESNGIYAPHFRQACALPFLDVYFREEQLSLFYRMYWQKVQYIPVNILIQKMAATQETYNQEYSAFKWIEAKKILKAVNMQDPLLDKEETIYLYGPLVDNLSTLGEQTLSTELVTTQKLNLYSKAIKDYASRLYFTSSKFHFYKETVQENIKIHWILPKITYREQKEKLDKLS